VALVEKMSHQKIIDETRYKIDSNNSVVIDRTKAMSRKQTRTTDTARKMVQDIEYFLNNIDEYISDNRKVKPDITNVINSIDEIQKKISYVVRLLVSLVSHSEIVIKKKFYDSTPNSKLQNTYWNLINLVIDKHVSEDHRDSVINQLQKTLKEL